MKTPLNEKYWMAAAPNGQILVGLTEEYVKMLGVIWAFIPRASQSLEQDKPFANVESSKCLGPLRSPINGVLVEWNKNLLQRPHTITSDDFLFKAKGA